MWKKIKIVFISISIIAVSIIAFIFGSRSDRSGISDDNGLTDRIARGNQTVETGLDELNSGLESGIKTSGDITKRAGNIEDKLGTAIRILRAAKEKNRSDLVG